MANILLISYDNDSHIPFFPINLAYLSNALLNAGHNVGIWSQDLHHGKERALTGILNENPFHVAGLGFVAGYYQYAKAKKISKAVNESNRRAEINYILGGHGPAADPEFFLNSMSADTVVVGDGEKALVEIVNGNKRGIVQGERCDIDEAPIKAYENLFDLNIYRLIRWPTSNRTDFCFPILSSRGCKWHCSFCYRMRDGFYERKTEAIMDEIRWLYRNCNITHFQFADELLMSSEKRTEGICNAILALPFKVTWDCNGRLNYAKPDILALMRRSGCSYVNYGIESLNQSRLNQMGKGLTVDRIYQGVRDTLQAGISPGLNLLWGFPGDTLEDLREEVRFLKQYDPCDELRTIRPVTPYPGTLLYKKAIEMGLMKDCEDFYEIKHENSDLFTVNFMNMSMEEAHRHLRDANKELYLNYLRKGGMNTLKQMDKLYWERDASFRGFRGV